MAIVAVLILAAVVGTAFVSGLANPPGQQAAPAPTATFGPAAVLPYEVDVPLASMSRVYPSSDYLLRMADGSDASQYVGMPGDPSMATYATMTVGNGSYAVFWRDRGTPSMVDGGDAFLVSPVHGTVCPASGMYLMLYWMNRTLLATSNFGWNCTSKVSMTLGTPTSMGMMGNGSMGIPVTSVSANVLPMNFMIRLMVGSNLSYPVWMAMGNGTSVLMSGYASSFDMGWSDVDGSGTLSAGDRLSVSMPTMMSTGMTITMYVLWRDAGMLSVASWTT